MPVPACCHPVNVKWNKSSYDVDVEAAEGLETFQAALFSLTNVPADRQKLMCKGKLLRADADIAALTSDSKVMLMGTADALAAAPTKQVLFEEDLTDKDRVKLAASSITSAGLTNLGNTCHLPHRKHHRSPYLLLTLELTEHSAHPSYRC